LDCWGLLKSIYTDLGCEIFDIETLEYTKTWARSGEDYFKDNYSNDWEETDTPKLLDAVLFNNKRGVANHAGVVLTGGRFIHAPRQGVIVSRLNDDVWKRKLEGFYRLKKRTW
jgi:cell wall-associated NlpC family hydrolase